MKIKFILFTLFFFIIAHENAYSKGHKKIALLFLTVEDLNHPGVWKKLLENQRHQYNIYFHSKNSMQDKDFKKFRIDKTVKTTWCKHVKAWKALLNEAIQDEDNYKFVYLSESCIPLMPLDDIYKILTADNNSYMQFRKPFWPEINARTIHELPEKHRWVNNEWVILNRKHAEVVVRDIHIISACNRHHHSQEAHPSCLFSVKHCLDDPELLNKQTTWVNFDLGHDSHPYSFDDESPFNMDMMQEAKMSGRLFIRKIAKTFPENVLLDFIHQK